MTVSLIVQSLVNALLLGSLYGLLAIGYSVVYGILQFINFAHGNVFMAAAYVPIVVTSWLALPWPVSFVITVLSIALLGSAIDRIGFRPLRTRKAPKLSNLASAIGISFFLENAALLLFGGAPRSFPAPAILRQSYQIAGIWLPSVAIYSVPATVVALLILYQIVYQTKTGLAMRALSEDLEVAGLMGIQTNRVIAVAFALGSGLAAVAAIMWCCRFPMVRPTMASTPSTKAFVAAVLGGVGNINGALVGGLLLGLGEIMFVTMLPSLSAYRDVFAFLVLVGVLLLRPAGLLGATVHEEKL